MPPAAFERRQMVQMDRLAIRLYCDRRSFDLWFRRSPTRPDGSAEMENRLGTEQHKDKIRREARRLPAGTGSSCSENQLRRAECKSTIRPDKLAAHRQAGCFPLGSAPAGRNQPFGAG